MDLFSSSTIFYPPYLVSGLIITFLWMRIESGLPFKEIPKLFFSKEIWFSKEILIDLACCIFILLILKKYFSYIEDWIFTHQFFWLSKLHSPWAFKLNPLIEGLMVTATTMLSIDLASYFIHRLMHTYKWLWKTHRFHHTITHLNLLSTYRQNPFEFMFLNGSRILAARLGLLVFYWFFPEQTSVMTIQGLGAGFFIYMFTVNLHHSHIPVRYPRFLRFVLISPHVHHLHHSNNPKHFGKNYGVVFSIWDRIFKTYYEEDVKLGELRFGNAQLSK
jgi:sterol desaturase/sphingolipid hydroxylase (fatty acid hydroxylase superfamily)